MTRAKLHVRIYPSSVFHRLFNGSIQVVVRRLSYNILHRTNRNIYRRLGLNSWLRWLDLLTRLGVNSRPMWVELTTRPMWVELTMSYMRANTLRVQSTSLAITTDVSPTHHVLNACKHSASTVSPTHHVLNACKHSASTVNIAGNATSNQINDASRPRNQSLRP